jgi:hypothetical protein
VHDIADLESRGIPGVCVASTEFADATEAQGDALGLRVAAVFVPHPIQDRTDQEIRDLADGAVDAIIAAVLAV